MIIKANSYEGSRTLILDKDGNRITLPIKEYNTETQEAVVFELDENNKIKMTEWEKGDGDKMVRQHVTKTVKLEGSYAINRETGKPWE